MTSGRPLLLLFSLLCVTAAPAVHAVGEPAAATPAPAADNLELKFANGIAAVVEDRVITIDDIRREISPLLPRLRSESRNEKEFNDKLDTLQSDIVRNLADRVLIIKEFYKDERRKIPDSYVDNAIAEQMTTQFGGDRAKFLAYIRQRGLTFREYRKEMEENIVYSYMRGQQRKSQSVVSPAKVEAYYAEHGKDFYQDERIHMRLIQVNRGAAESDAAFADRTAALLARLDAGEAFADVAKELSQDSRKSRGGDWGWQTRADLKPEFAEPLFKLSKGGHTPAVRVAESTFILYVEDRLPAGIPPIDEVRSKIELILVQHMARESQEKWLERLRRNAYVKYY